MSVKKLLAYLNPLNWFPRKVSPTAPTVRIAPRAWQGDDTWPFIAVQDGDDIVLRAKHGANLYVTWFGGDDDPQDNGETASGVRTKGNPNITGCALPMNYFYACAGSPIPRLPWRTAVSIEDGKHRVTVPLIDIGPNKKTGNTADLTQAAFKVFCTLRVGKFAATLIRIHDAAKFFK